MNEAADIFLVEPKAPEELRKEFCRLLEELESTPSQLALRMIQLGDHRSHATISRGLQRMVSGETGVSGEMLVIARMLYYRQIRRTEEATMVHWRHKENGDVCARVRNFRITLCPQNRGRWQVNVDHNDGYSHPWPAWQSSLAAAKRKALACVDDAENFMADGRFAENLGDLVAT